MKIQAIPNDVLIKNTSNFELSLLIYNTQRLASAVWTGELNWHRKLYFNVIGGTCSSYLLYILTHSLTGGVVYYTAGSQRAKSHSSDTRRRGVMTARFYYGYACCCWDFVIKNSRDGWWWWWFSALALTEMNHLRARERDWWTGWQMAWNWCCEITLTPLQSFFFFFYKVPSNSSSVIIINRLLKSRENFLLCCGRRAEKREFTFSKLLASSLFLRFFTLSSRSQKKRKNPGAHSVNVNYAKYARALFKTRGYGKKRHNIFSEIQRIAFTRWIRPHIL